MKNNLQQQLKWFQENENEARKSNFRFVNDRVSLYEYHKEKSSACKNLPRVCMSFAELGTANSSKFRQSVQPLPAENVSKKSFLTNLKFCTFKSDVQRKQPPNPADSNKSIPQVASCINGSSTAPMKTEEPSLDISDEAFLNFDIDAAISSSSRSPKIQESVSKGPPFPTTFPNHANKYSNSAVSKQISNPLTHAFDYNSTQNQDDDEVAMLERAAEELQARLRKAKAEKAMAAAANNNVRPDSSISYSSWESTPSEVQRRATTSFTSHSSLGQSVVPSNTNYDYDYNQNIDQCNLQGSSYFNDNCDTNDLADSNIPMCSCGLRCVSLTSRTANSMGRVFFKCPQPRESTSRCDFFQWEDESYGNNDSCISGTTEKDFVVENKRMFGHNKFREGQRECIEAALSGRDVFCLMPTGGGKSLVYQLPAWCCSGLAVVFSPLISLIQDQVEALHAMGIRAAYFSASKNEADNASVFEELYQISIAGKAPSGEAQYSGREGMIKLLYLTPEKYKNSPKMKSSLRRLYNSGNLSRFVIDEAHCLSEWGHDFRPDYISLSDLKAEFPKTPIMALTATANKTVADDCIRILRLDNPFRHTHSFNRPNITYYVKKKGKKVMEEMGKFISQRQSQTGIVYCFSKKDTEKVCDELKKAIPSLKDKITFYHADVSPHEKDRRQFLWSQGDVKVICATIAFGMGINKPDVRYVIHYSLPKSLTNYYQESGRAGRDGGLSESIVFYSYSDKQRLCALAQKGSEIESASKKQAAIDRALRNISEVAKYCMNRIDCRRSLVLEYFGEKFPREKCQNTCDNCTDQGCWEMTDYKAQGLVVLTVLRNLSSMGRPNLTLQQLKNLLTNSKDKKLQSYRTDLEKRGVVNVVKHELKGKQLVMSKDSCEALLQTMVLKGFLTEVSQATMSGFTAEYITLGPEAHNLENGSSPLELCLSVSSKNSANVVPSLRTHSIVHDQLSDEQFLEFDIDAAVAKAGRLSDESFNARKVGNDLKLVPEQRNVPHKPLAKRNYELSDSSEEEESGSWALVNDNEDIRSRNKGKSKSGAFSLNLTGKTTQPRKKNRYEFDLTVDQEEPSNAMDVDESGSEGPFELTKKQKFDFRQWLWAFRKRWKNYWVVLNNNSVQDIIEQIPLSKRELSSVSGFGENKVKSYGDTIIATIWAFLRSRNLLEKFPSMVEGGYLEKPPVEIKECPTWRDPISSEAQEILAREAQLKDQPSDTSRVGTTNASPYRPFPQYSSPMYSQSHAVTTQHSPESPSLISAENSSRGKQWFN